MATAREKVYSVLDHVSRSLDNLDAPVMRAILPVLNQAHDEVQVALRRWIARERGGETFTAQRHRNVLLHLRHSLDKLESSGAVAERSLKKSYATVGPLSMRNLKHEWAAFSRIFEGTAQPLALDEAVVIATGKKLLWPQFESSAKKYAGRVGERARHELAVSRARSETIDELTNRLQKRLPDVFRANRWDAERLARTESLNSYNVVHERSIIEAHKEDADLMSRWDASRDFRRCPMCASLDGQVVDISKGEKFVAHWFSKSKKRGAREHTMTIDCAPSHPCCRCVIVAWRASWAAYARNKQQIDEGGRLAA
jgi:hypothetical protein